MARQCDLILMHILKYGSITHLEAEKEYGCARLAARIADLRREGTQSPAPWWRARTGVESLPTMRDMSWQEV